MRRAALIVTLFCCCLAEYAAGQSSYHFSRLTVEDGLSSNCIVSICQDRSGRMWFATNDGLSTYDGYDIRVYKHDPEDEATLPSNVVNRLRLDSDGRLWVCTASGLSWYDADLDIFHRVKFENVQSVEDIVQLGPSLYLATTRNFSLLFDMQTSEVRECLVNGNPLRFYVSAGWNGKRAFATLSRTVEILAVDADTLKRVRNPIRTRSSVSTMVYAGGGRCLAGMQKDGLLLLDLEEGNILMTRSDIHVSALERDASGHIWAGTSDHLEIMDTEGRTETVLRSDPLDPSSLSNNGIRSLYKDSAGGMWVGTEYGGVCYWNSREPVFDNFKNLPSERAIGDNIVSSMHAGPDGKIWIGTRYGGLDCWQPESGKMAHYYAPENIRSIWVPESGWPVYVGCDVHGLNILYRDGSRRNIPRPSDVNAILPAGEGKLWIGALVGLFLYDTKQNSVRQVQLTPGRLNRILTMTYDSDGLLWIGAKESLRIYKVGEDESLTDVSGDLTEGIVQVQCFHEGGDSLMWIGCADGLLYFDKRNSSVGRPQSPGELRQAAIRGIEEDAAGCLWVSTDRGLSKFNPASGECRTYYSYDGLPCDQFNIYAHCKDGSGNLWFGGIGGLSCFNPGDVTDNPVTSAPILTGLYVHNAEVRPGDGTGILKKAVSRVGSIVLKHSRNSFRLTFSCPDFASGGRNTFAYRLAGFDKSWIETRSREAVYSNLRKGTYRFELRVANSDGVWSPEEATLSIRVRPPWYGTLFAEICFAMVLLAGLIFLMNEILRRNNLRNAEAMEKMKERYERQVRHARVTAFLSDPSKQLGEADETFLCRVLDLIDAGLTHPQFSVETLAEKVGMTRSNLHLKMKTIAGISPIDLITRIRLEKAAELLRGGRLTMSEIAEETGFNSASYFSSCFRKATGLTPKDYAARFRTSD